MYILHAELKLKQHASTDINSFGGTAVDGVSSTPPAALVCSERHMEQLDYVLRLFLNQQNICFVVLKKKEKHIYLIHPKEFLLTFKKNPDFGRLSRVSSPPDLLFMPFFS